MTSPCRSSGCEATVGAPKNLQARFAPYGFWRKFFNPSSRAVENFSPKALHIFSPSVSAPETSKVKPPTRHKKKVNVMKKKIEIQQDLKRGFGSAPTGIKNLVKWSLIGFVVYVAVRFVCAFLGGMLPMLAVLAVVVSSSVPCGVSFAYSLFSSLFFA